MRRLLRSRRGQILIPSILILPSLVLFVWLIYETARLSRDKIRHQFAIDAAVFVEMTNYSDFLNRSAYVNGAFPQRIFKEGFEATTIDMKKGGKGSLYDILYLNGLFPKTAQGNDNALNTQQKWQLKFGGCGDPGKNGNPPDMSTCQDDPTYSQAQLAIITHQNAMDYYINWDDAQDIYQLYVKIYQLLGSVEDAQYQVLQRLRSGHGFLAKSYWMNTGGSLDRTDDAKNEAAVYFENHQFKPEAYCVDNVTVYGNKPTSSPFQPYQIFGPQSPLSMSGNSMPECKGGPGLFQLMTAPDSQLASMNQPSAISPYPGYGVVQHWTVAQNKFGVDFNSLSGQTGCPGSSGGNPCLHATVALINSVGSASAMGGSLWPDPTPKFQTRLYP